MRAVEVAKMIGGESFTAICPDNNPELMGLFQINWKEISIDTIDTLIAAALIFMLQDNRFQYQDPLMSAYHQMGWYPELPARVLLVDQDPESPDLRVPRAILVTYLVGSLTNVAAVEAAAQWLVKGTATVTMTFQ